jgi:hypothetical protein
MKLITSQNLWDKIKSSDYLSSFKKQINFNLTLIFG